MGQDTGLYCFFHYQHYSTVFFFISIRDRTWYLPLFCFWYLLCGGLELAIHCGQQSTDVYVQVEQRVACVARKTSSSSDDFAQPLL